MKLSRVIILLLLLSSGSVYGQWSTSTLSEKRGKLAAAAAGSKILFAGGRTSTTTVTNRVDIYDNNAGTWSTSTLTVARESVGATAVGNKVLFAGGYLGGTGSPTDFSNVVDIYDVTTNTWTTATLSLARFGIAATTVGTKAMFAGGQRSGSPFNSNVVDIYNSATNTWSTATLSSARAGLAAISSGSKAFFAGGSNSNIVDIYDNNTNTWSTATLSVGRTDLVAAAVGTKVLFAGGSTSTAYSNIVDIFDTATNTWSTATLSVVRGNLAATTVGTKVIFAGGRNTLPQSDVVDIYDNATGTWSTAKLSAARGYLAAATVDTKAFFGGGGDTQFNSSQVVDIYDIETVAPLVSTFAPADNAANVAINSSLTLTFNENIQKGTGNILIKEGGVLKQTIDVTGTNVTVNAKTLVINPPSDFSYSAAVNIEMPAGIVKDVAGNNFAGITNATTWNFTTAADPTPPAIVSLSPADNATGVGVGVDLVLTFNEIVQKGTGNIVIKEGLVVKQTINVADAIVTVSGAVVTINPVNFASSSSVNIEIAAGVFKDLAGNNWVGFTTTTAWNFTTADVLNPTITTLSPVADASNVSVASNLVMTLSEPVQKGSGSILIKENGAVAQTIDVTSSAVTISSNQVSINPPANFSYGALVNIEIPATAFKDANNNNFEGITSATRWSFTVVSPTITSFSPATGYEGVQVTISGSNFSNTPAENIVKFNGTTATVASSSSGSIITSVPPGATTGKITVTREKGTATSATDFTVTAPPAPVISSFSPASGVIGSTVTIFGSNFSPNSGSNVVKFNGVAATLSSAPGTSSLTVTVPAGASTGKITVTVSNQTATSANEFAVNGSSIARISAESFPSLFLKADGLKVSITVNDATKVKQVIVKSKGISEPTSALKTTTVSPIANKYEFTVPAAQLADPIGVGYYFEVTDQQDNKFTSTKARSVVRVPAGSADLEIPDLVFGGEASKYQIIAVPLNLSNSSVTSVFSALGGYDNTQWRLFDYAGNSNREYPSFSTIVPGKGYWLIARYSAKVSTGEGTAVNVDENNPFVITLVPGWNLIGNPYNFGISWTDVLTANNNPTTIDKKIKTFSNGTLTATDVLPRFRGAFVFNAGTSNVAMKIPVQKNSSIGGRLKMSEPVDLNELNWDLALNVSNGTITNELGGIGMNKKATIEGKDSFDEFLMPVPDAMTVGGIVHASADASALTKSIVSPHSSYTWNFSLSGTSGESMLLTWNNAFVETQKQLMLVDERLNRIVDMKLANSMTVKAGTNLKIVFGDPEYVRGQLPSDLALAVTAFPNPSSRSAEVKIGFINPLITAVPATIRIVNAQGAQTNSIVTTAEQGYNELTWKPAAAGVYVVQVLIGGMSRNVKVVVN